MRTFVAIDIPSGIRQRIRELMEVLQRTAAPVRWARLEGLHVTLKFIGEGPDEKVEAIKAALQSVKLPAAIDIAVQGCGFFPNEKSPRVIWLGIRAGDGLAEMAGRIDERLGGLGIARENRPFAPHLTLGRLSVPDKIPAARELLHQREPLDLGVFTATEFFLYESKLARGGSIYSKIARYPFVNSEQTAAL